MEQEKRSDATMAAPYSYDLRQKAIEAVKGGERKTDVAQMLNISRNTLNLWLKREEETGDYRAITNFQQGSRHKITDWQRFEEFVQKHGDKTQKQMAKLWGEGVTQQNISDALMKLGLSRKKRLTDTESATNSSGRSLRND
jgi:transposase